MDFSNVFCTLLIAFFTFLVYLAYSRYKQLQLFKNLRIPGPEPNFVTGNGSDLHFGSDGPAVTLEKWRQKYGKVFGYFSANIPTLVITDVNLIKQIAIKDFQIFPDRFVSTSETGTSLVFEKGARWKHVRKTLTPAFSASKLKHLTPIMKRAVEDFQKELTKVASNEKEFDIYDRFQRLTLDIIGESALAMKINCQEIEDNKLFEDVKKIMKIEKNISSIFGLLQSYFFKVEKLVRFVMVFSSTGKSMMSVISNLKSVISTRRGQSTGKTVDMLQLMLEAAVKDQKLTTTNGSKPLTDDELIGNCFVFILAGFETTAASMGYLAYVLSKHSDVQDKVYKEIQENVKDVLNVTYEDANNLPYLDQVINEALRLYPPVHTLLRVNSNQEYVIDGKKIPKNVSFEFPSKSIHRDPELWPEPDKFDPDRFSPENKVKIPLGAHLPFGIGPRNCIGMRFALLEIKLTMIRLLREYRLVSPENFVLEVTIPAVMVVPKNGVIVKLESRTV